ncbi:putative parathyroid hormone-related protein-like, partial [Scophthalmus maximus]
TQLTDSNAELFLILMYFYTLHMNLCLPVPALVLVPVLVLLQKRSVTHAQLMHDKGRTLQDFKRRMWLQELLDEVHTAEIRDLPVRTTGGGGGGGGGGSSSGGLPGGGLGINLSTTGSTLHSKPPGGTKNLPISFRLEEEEGTNLPQETNKSQTYKDGVLRAPGKKKKKEPSELQSTPKHSCYVCNPDVWKEIGKYLLSVNILNIAE